MGARFVCPAKPLSDWSTHELERGLESLGFTQYSRPLRAAGISGRVLSELAEGGGLFDGLFDDLRVSESHRIWLRSALQALPAAIALAQRTSTSYQPTAASPPHSAHSVVAHTSPKLKRPRLRRADSSADRAMMELDHFLRPHKQRVEDEWTRQLRDMEYPQKRTDVERATRSPGGNSERVKGPRQPIARGLRRTRSFQPAERIDEAILENFRHRDAHLLTEGVYFFVTHRHHRGRLRDSIKDVVHSRYFKLGLKLYEIKNAILIFPSVVLEICRVHGLTMSPAQKTALVEVPRVAMDCIDEVLAELREQRRISRESDAAINEIMPNSQLYAVPSHTVNVWQLILSGGAPHLGWKLPLWGERCIKLALVSSVNSVNMSHSIGTIATLQWPSTTATAATVSEFNGPSGTFPANSLSKQSLYSHVTGRGSSQPASGPVLQKFLDMLQNLAPDDLYPLIGARVNNRYIIREYMANGSFAHVWKAFDTLELRHVVVKIFRGIHDVQFDTGKVNVVAEGYHELQTNRKLMALDASGALPPELTMGMVRVVDVTDAKNPALIVRRDGLSGAIHYTCSEFCEERDLTYLRAQKPNFEEETARHIFSQVIRTVAAMHAQKWYHQDLKVENIFVQRDKEQRFLFKIGDFGRLVTRDSEADHETGTLKCLGRTAPSYVAPEAKKETREYYDGGPADVWAAGVMLLHLVLDAPSILQAVEWNHRSFIKHLAPLHCENAALLRKRMAHSNVNNLFSGRSPSGTQASSDSASSKHLDPEKSVGGRTFFSDHEFKLCSWLDNIGFSTDHRSVHDRGGNQPFQVYSGAIETVWLHGHEVKMKILSTSKPGVWYLARASEYEAAEKFILRYHEVQQIGQFAPGSTLEAEPHNVSPHTPSLHQKRSSRLLQTDTLRWLHWKPVFEQLEKKLLARSAQTRASQRGLLRQLTLCQDDPACIRHILKHRPVIEPPRTTGQIRFLSSEAFLILATVLADHKDPTHIMKKYGLHAKDVPLTRRSRRLKGRSSRDECPIDTDFLKSIASASSLPSNVDGLGDHLASNIRWTSRTRKRSKLSILQFAEQDFDNNSGAQRQVLDTLRQWDVLHPFQYHTCDISKLATRLDLNLSKKESKIRIFNFGRHQRVYEKTTSDLRVVMNDLSSVHGSAVVPDDFTVLPQLTETETACVKQFLRYAWPLQQLFDALRYKYEDAHGAGNWPLGWHFLKALDATLMKAVTNSSFGTVSSLCHSFMEFETALLVCLRSDKDAVLILQRRESQRPMAERNPPLYYLTPAPPCERRPIEDYQKIENMDFVKYPFSSLSSWRHFRHHLERRLHHNSTVGRQLLSDLPPELDDLFERMFEYNPRCRISAAEILQHPWLTRANHSQRSSHVIAGPEKANAQDEILLGLQRRVMEQRTRALRLSGASTPFQKNAGQEYEVKVKFPVPDGEAGHDLIRELLQIVARQLDALVIEPHPDDDAADAGVASASLLDGMGDGARTPSQLGTPVREHTANSAGSTVSSRSQVSETSDLGLFRNGPLKRRFSEESCASRDSFCAAGSEAPIAALNGATEPEASNHRASRVRFADHMPDKTTATSQSRDPSVPTKSEVAAVDADADSDADSLFDEDSEGDGSSRRPFRVVVAEGGGGDACPVAKSARIGNDHNTRLGNLTASSGGASDSEDSLFASDDSTAPSLFKVVVGETPDPVVTSSVGADDDSDNSLFDEEDDARPAALKVVVGSDKGNIEQTGCATTVSELDNDSDGDNSLFEADETPVPVRVRVQGDATAAVPCADPRTLLHQRQLQAVQDAIKQPLRSRSVSETDAMSPPRSRTGSEIDIMSPPRSRAGSEADIMSPPRSRSASDTYSWQSDAFDPGHRLRELPNNRMYIIEELGGAHNGFIAKVAVTTTPGPAGRSACLQATWTRGLVASKWLGLKARLDEAFSNHVARFVGAAEELLKQLRMLVLSGWGPQQREHGTLVTMRIFCDFFVTCHFVKEFRFCNYGEQRASVFGQLWRLLNDESSCTALFHFGKQDREDLVTFFMQGQEVPPSTMVIRKKLEGIVGKFQRGEPAAVHAHEEASLSNEERGLHVLHRLYGALDVVSRRMDRPGKKSVRSIMLQSIQKAGVQPVQEGQTSRSSASNARPLTQISLPARDTVETSTALSRAEIYLRDAVLLPKSITTGLYDATSPCSTGSLSCCDEGCGFIPASDNSSGAYPILGASSDTVHTVAVRHAPHFMQIISQGMQPSVHVEHLQAIHNQLQNVVVALGGRLPWPFQPLPQGVRYALEPLTRKRETREKVEFYKLPCHVFALRPDVGPPPVHGNGVDLLRNKLQELAAGKTRDVRDRLLLVRRSILQLRENLLGLPESGGESHGAPRATSRAHRRIPASEDALHPELWAQLRAYDTLSSIKHTASETATIQKAGQVAIDGLLGIASMDIRRRFLARPQRVIRAVLQTQFNLHGGVDHSTGAPGCTCLSDVRESSVIPLSDAKLVDGDHCEIRSSPPARKIPASTTEARDGSRDHAGNFSFSPTRAGADRTIPCSKPAHLSRIIATLLVQAALLSKQRRTSSIRQMLSLCSSLQERVERACRAVHNARSLVGPSGAQNKRCPPSQETEMLDALLERNHRKIGDLEAEVRLLDGTRHAGAKLALEESRDLLLAQLLGYDEQHIPRAGYLKARRVRGKLAGRLGKILFALGEHSRALHFFRVALQSSDPMPADVSDFAANPRHSLAVGGLLNNIGKCLLQQHKWQLARCHLNQALTVKLNVLGKQHASVGATCLILACVYVGEAKAYMGLLDPLGISHQGASVAQAQNAEAQPNARRCLEDALALLMSALMLLLDDVEDPPSEGGMEPAGASGSALEAIEAYCKIGETYLLLVHCAFESSSLDSELPSQHILEHKAVRAFHAGASLWQAQHQRQQSNCQPQRPLSQPLVVEDMLRQLPHPLGPREYQQALELLHKIAAED